MAGPEDRPKKRRWGEQQDPAKLLALQESVKARLAAAKAQAAADQSRPSKKAKVFELDMTVTGPTFRKEAERLAPPPAAAAPPAPPPPPSNPYLAHAIDTTETPLDERLGRVGKNRTHHKPLTFVEPGQWQERAEKHREKVALAQPYLSGRKVGHTITAPTLASVYGGVGDAVDETLPPRWDAHPDTNMPLALEWWDMELLPKGLQKQVAAAEAKQLKPLTQEKTDDEPVSDMTTHLRETCLQQASLSYSKTATLVQHIVPIRPAHANLPAQQPVVHLTKKELKRQRKLRRQEKQREMQDLQAAGLVPAPEPRLTLSNFIRVLGDQAYLDPSQMEQKVLEQMEARQRAHLERNAATKLTKEQRAEKRSNKLREDTTKGVTVAIFYVKDMTHPYHRTKLDLNAQQNNVSGGVLESAEPGLACVICEGGPKAIKRLVRLMTVRMKWTGPSEDEEESSDDEDENPENTKTPFNPDNRCDLVWQGMAAKRLFNGFVFQSCETPNQARKILKAKGVAHYWDQVMQHAAGNGQGIQFRLTEDSDEEDNPFQQPEDEDIVMKE